MIIYSSNNVLKVKDIKPIDTVQDYLDALDMYLKSEPLPCEECRNNCCKRSGWSIAIDNVYFLKKVNNSSYNMDKFFKRECFQISKSETSMPHYSIKHPFKSSCKDLNGLNQCNIYKNRPLICRTYTCIKKDDKLELMSNLIGETAKYAFSYNYVYLKTGEIFFKELYEENPFYNKYDYNLLIKDVLKYASTVYKNSILDEESFYLKELLKDFEINN